MKNELETTEVMPGQFEPSPFPMDLETQKRLLELIYNRKSGIITRQELIDVIFSTENTPSGHIIRYRA
jgi:hypothetical protein